MYTNNTIPYYWIGSYIKLAECTTLVKHKQIHLKIKETINNFLSAFELLNFKKCKCAQ